MPIVVRYSNCLTEYFIGFVFNRIGMLPELGSHSLLPRIVGFSNAAQLLMGGEIIDANTAMSMGLVSQVYPDEDLLDKVVLLLNACRYSFPVSVTASKRLLWEGLSLSWEEMHNKETPFSTGLPSSQTQLKGSPRFLKRAAN